MRILQLSATVGLAAASYTLQSTDCDADHTITSAGECQYAALHLDLDDVTASSASSSYPTGCSYRNDRLRFDEDGDNTVACSEERQCICKGDDYVPVDAMQYMEVTDSETECAALSQEDCLGAALLLDMNDGTLSTRDSNSYPSACSATRSGRSVTFNTNEDSTRDCRSSRPCICHRPEAQCGEEPEDRTDAECSIKELVEATNIYECDYLECHDEKLYKVVTEGTCDVYITSEEECEYAAKVMGFDDLTASARDTNSDPYGCSARDNSGPVVGKSLRFNERTSSDDECTESRYCICKDETLAPTPSPTPVITDCRASVVDEDNCDTADCSNNVYAEGCVPEETYDFITKMVFSLEAGDFVETQVCCPSSSCRHVDALGNECAPLAQ